MSFNELKLGIIFAFAFSATVTPIDCAHGLSISPTVSKFMLPVGTPLEIICSDISETSKRIETLSWRREKGDFSSKGNASEKKIADNSVTLTFTNPTQDDSGKYYCVYEFYYEARIFEPKGKTQKIIEVNFFNTDPELKFESSFENIFAEEGSTLEVNCSATGDKPIHYEWRNQYQEVISSSSQTLNEPISVSETENGSILKIFKMNSNITGSYTCKASNKYSLANKEYEILIRSETDDGKDNSIPIVRHVQVINQTSNSVHFGISVSGAANYIRTRYVEKVDDTLHERVWKRGDTYEVKDLIPGSSYSFKFKAIPQDIFSESMDKGWSKEHVVVMLPTKPDVIFRKHFGGSIEIGWNRNKDTYKVDKYKLTYFPIWLNKDTHDWTESNCPITVDIPYCSNVNYTISGLRSNMYYELQLQAHTAAGYGKAHKQRIYVK